MRTRRGRHGGVTVIAGLRTGEIKTKLLRVHSRCSGAAAHSYPVLKCPTQQVSPFSCGFSGSLLKRHLSPSDPQQPEKLCLCLLPVFQPAVFSPKGLCQSLLFCSPLVTTLCRAQLLSEEETSRRDPPAPDGIAISGRAGSGQGRRKPPQKDNL